MIVPVCMMLILAACGSEPDSVVLADEKKAETIRQYVTEYKAHMIAAANEGDLKLVEDYLIPNTSFYHSLSSYIEDLHREGTVKELHSFEVGEVYWDQEAAYFVDVHEEIELINDNESERINRNVQFELAEGGDGTFRVVLIVEK